MLSNVWAIVPDYLEQTLLALRPKAQPQQAHISALEALPPTALEGQGYSLINGVAVIDVRGAITRTTCVDYWTGKKNSQGQDAILSSLRAALADDAARAILLTVDSPGGLVAGTKELADAIFAASKRKPCAAYVDGMCASAAYWLAAATGRVLAPVTAGVGSVGIIAVRADMSKLHEGMGITITYLTAGKYKAEGNEALPLSDEERQRTEAQLAKIHSIFKADVVRSMGIAAPTELWAEGQLLLAEDAQRVGLVSRIVQDKDAAIFLLSQEVSMTKEELMAQAPELVQALHAEGQAMAQAQAETQAQAHNQSLLLLVGAVAGEAAALKVQELAALNFTAEQITAMSKAGMLPAHSAATVREPIEPQAHNTKSDILAALKAAHGSPLPAAQPANPAPTNRLAHAVSLLAGKAQA